MSLRTKYSGSYRDVQDREAAEMRAKPQGQFRGTTFVSGSELTKQADHKRKLALIRETGGQAVLNTKTEQDAITGRFDKEQEGIDNRFAATNSLERDKLILNRDFKREGVDAIKKKQWGDRILKLTTDEYDDTGTLIRKGMDMKSAEAFLTNLDKGYQNNTQKNTTSSNSTAKVFGEKGNIWSMDRGSVVTSTPKSRATTARDRKTLSNIGGRKPFNPKSSKKVTPLSKQLFRKNTPVLLRNYREEEPSA